ncbi:unnamed protein product [marine sediment metagenome]|uniref:Uncharacterized protein n=1 Tax=marine sediment metagenome TaxID=412755 RepID=X1JHM4_9ZZZZ
MKYFHVLILSLFLTVFLSSLAFGSSFIFIEDFDSYDLGYIAGQGDWTTCRGWISGYVGNVDPYRGEKHLYLPLPPSNVCNERVGTQIASGTISFFVKIPWPGGVKNTLQVGQWISSTSTNPSSFAQMRFIGGGDVKWTDSTGIHHFLCGTDANYTGINISWNATTNKVKYDCLGNTSGWVDVSSYSAVDFDYFNVIRVIVIEDGAATYYIDNIGLECAIGQCFVCQNLTECWSAGCSWFYNSETYTSSCYEPLGEMECGVFSNCQYCETQETCEAGFNCEWKDYGFGTQCYYEQYLPATTTVEWTVPDLEDCEPLSGVEKWLCEIKNFIAGIFYPSQEKLNELHNILLDFRQKFPFNYINIFKSFLTDIREDIDEEASISVKILGHEHNVNFNFWNATTTIRGVSESFKNIIVDMTTALILLTFLVWVVSFLRRFF